MIDAGAEREHLWQQLLDGSLTEVYVLGSYLVIPQTLGLEPISARAYHYNRANGELTSVPERVEIARQLAAQRFWIAGGGGLYWDRRFIDEVEYDPTQMRFDKRLREFSMDYSPKYRSGTSNPEYYTMLVVKHLLEKYPEKTFIVSNPREIRKLKALRIPRDRHQSGS